MRHVRTSRWLLVAGALLLAQGGVLAQGPTAGPKTCPPAVVFVANSGCEGETLSERLNKVFTRNALPYKIVTVNYTSNAGRIADFRSTTTQLVGGARLACQVLALHRSCPNTKIYLVGFGTGSAVILAAAEQLPLTI